MTKIKVENLRKIITLLEEFGEEINERNYYSDKFPLQKRSSFYSKNGVVSDTTQYIRQFFS
jgi:hypothetical protein